MLAELVFYIKGYVIIHTKGRFLERFLNLCLSREILLYDLKRSENEMTAKMLASDFCLIKDIAKKTKTSVRIVKKSGLRFSLKRRKKRKGVVFGAILFAVTIWYFSTHLMGITITGNKNTGKEEIIAALNSYGVKIGVSTDEIDTKKLKNRLMTAIPKLSWNGVSLKGSRLYIEVRERKEREEIDISTPCDIIASKSGIVRLMKIRDGQTVIKTDTFVNEGDLLVSGVIDSNSRGMRYTHSYGEVMADTNYKESIKIPLKYKRVRMTGKRQTKYDIEIFSATLKLYFSPNPKFERYKLHNENRSYAPPLEIFPPITVNKHIFLEQKADNEKRSEKEAENLGKFILCQKINQELSKGAKVKNVKVKSRKSGEYLIVTVEYECRENIAKLRPLDKKDSIEYNDFAKEIK